MKKELTAHYKGHVFTRYTDIAYTHVIIGRHSKNGTWESRWWATSLENAQQVINDFSYLEKLIIPVDTV